MRLKLVPSEPVDLRVVAHRHNFQLRNGDTLENGNKKH